MVNVTIYGIHTDPMGMLGIPSSQLTFIFFVRAPRGSPIFGAMSGVIYFGLKPPTRMFFWGGKHLARSDFPARHVWGDGKDGNWVQFQLKWRWEVLSYTPSNHLKHYYKPYTTPFNTVSTTMKRHQTPSNTIQNCSKHHQTPWNTIKNHSKPFKHQ